MIKAWIADELGQTPLGTAHWGMKLQRFTACLRSSDAAAVKLRRFTAGGDAAQGTQLKGKKSRPGAGGWGSELRGQRLEILRVAYPLNAAQGGNAAQDAALL